MSRCENMHKGGCEHLVFGLQLPELGAVGRALSLEAAAAVLTCSQHGPCRLGLPVLLSSRRRLQRSSPLSIAGFMPDRLTILYKSSSSTQS